MRQVVYPVAWVEIMGAAMHTSLLSSEITIPGAPALPGLHFRLFRGADDYEQIAAVINTSRQADGIDSLDTVEDVTWQLESLPNFDPYRDCIFAEVGGKVIGYGRVHWWTENDGTRVYHHTGSILPEWRRKGLGQAMLHYNENRLHQVANKQPGGHPGWLDAWVHDVETGYITLLEAEGYQPIRRFYLMVRPDLEAIPEAPLPEGFEIRPVEDWHIPLIHAASLDAFRDHWGSSDEAEPTLQMWKEQPWFDPSLWQVGWCGDQVAGMVMGFIIEEENRAFQRKRGWTENIFVRRPYRKHGLARALLVAALHTLKEAGMHEAALGVDTENVSGALRLYEGVGFRPQQRFAAYRKKLEN